MTVFGGLPHRFPIGPFMVGPGAPPVFFAEIGGFFGQDTAWAGRMINGIIDIARRVPEQPVILKTEILHDAEICLPGDLLETYASKAGEVRQENYRQLIERKVLPFDKYEPLLALCRERDMPVIVSVYDLAGADFAVEQRVAGLKIASSNIIHIPLIRHCAGKGLPLVLDTGRATLSEVITAVDTARQAGCENIIIEHSPDGHPAMPEAHNMRVLETYDQVFGLPVGLSDHHIGLEMLYVAVALGASVLEKGVHTAPDDLDIDISHTMDIEDLERVLRSVHACWQALGKTQRDMRDPIRGVLGSSQRQGLVTKRDIVAGEKVSLDTVRFAFPCKGISVRDWDNADDGEFLNDLAAGMPVGWGDIRRS